MNALLLCKTEENQNINKKFSELQMQQTFLIAMFFNQNKGMVRPPMDPAMMQTLLANGGNLMGMPGMQQNK